MVVTATVSFPVQVRINVNDDADIDFIQETLKDEADAIFESSSIDAVITECSLEECVE